MACDRGFPKAPEGEELYKLNDQFGVLQPVVTEKLSHVGEVLLFDVCLVIFTIGPRPGLFDFFGLCPVEKMVIEELSTVVAINS